MEGVCHACHWRCLECDIASDNCLVCADSRINTPDCTDCPTGFFDDLVHVDCQSCQPTHYKCLECNVNACEVCDVHRVAPYCTCEPGYVEVEGECVPCAYNCLTCTNNPENCVSCIPPRVNPNVCTCPHGYYDAMNGSADCP
jgi:proprotein convertase subtilisin/kexin type 5